MCIYIHDFISLSSSFMFLDVIKGLALRPDLSVFGPSVGFRTNYSLLRSLIFLAHPDSVSPILNTRHSSFLITWSCHAIFGISSFCRKKSKALYRVVSIQINDASLGRRVIGPRFVFDRPISLLECFSCPKVNLYLPSRRLPLIHLLQRLIYTYINCLEEPAQTFVPIQ